MQDYPLASQHFLLIDGSNQQSVRFWYGRTGLIGMLCQAHL
jgi:hypothetical protein